MALTERDKQIAGFAYMAATIGQSLEMMSKRLENAESYSSFPKNELIERLRRLHTSLSINNAAFNVLKAVEELKEIIDKRKAGLL